MLYLSIRNVFHGRHRIGLIRARAILQESVGDYRRLSITLAE